MRVKGGAQCVFSRRGIGRWVLGVGGLGVGLFEGYWNLVELRILICFFHFFVVMVREFRDFFYD